MKLVALSLQQLGQPFPAVSCLERDSRLPVELRQQLEERLGSLTIRRERSTSPCSPMAARCERLRCRSMPTEFIRGPPSVRGLTLRPRHIAPGTGALGGPLLHGIKSALDAGPPIWESSIRSGASDIERMRISLGPSTWRHLHPISGTSRRSELRTSRGCSAYGSGPCTPRRNGSSSYAMRRSTWDAIEPPRPSSAAAAAESSTQAAPRGSCPGS
jgi:hypothetical protein